MFESLKFYKEVDGISIILLSFQSRNVSCCSFESFGMKGLYTTLCLISSWPLQPCNIFGPILLYNHWLFAYFCCRNSRPERIARKAWNDDYDWTLFVCITTLHSATIRRVLRPLNSFQLLELFRWPVRFNSSRQFPGGTQRCDNVASTSMQRHIRRINVELMTFM